jgi:hypothetical protein
LITGIVALVIMVGIIVYGASRAETNRRNPVALPPGRATLSTYPAPTGSATLAARPARCESPAPSGQ